MESKITFVEILVKEREKVKEKYLVENEGKRIIHFF